MANPQNLKNFRKGHDPRRNLLGRPKDFEALRQGIRDLLAEPTRGNKTRLMRVLERMEKSPSGQIKLLEYGWGKVPDILEASGSLTLQVEGLKAILNKVYGGNGKAGSD